jgi:MoaA/NifB/PqqE/SkfB family radical SAM enzyme
MNSTSSQPRFDRSTTSFTFPPAGTSLSFFATLCLKVTGACAAHCDFCSEPDRSLPTLAASEWAPLIHDAIRSGTTRFSFSGGEPLLYPGLRDVLRTIKNDGASTLVATAAPDRMLRIAPELDGVLDAVRFSILGIGDAHDRRLGRRGSFALLDAAITECRRHGIQVLASTVATTDIIDELQSIVRWAADHGIPKIYVFELLDSGNGAAFRQTNGAVTNLEAIDAVDQAHMSGVTLRLIPNDLYGENVLCYGDGRVMLDPVPAPAGQELLGNWREEGINAAWSRFAQNERYLRSLAVRARLY